MRRSASTLLVVALSTSIVAYLWQSASRADSGNNLCCNGLNVTQCTGCINMGVAYVQVGFNDLYLCNAYVNPLYCDDTQLLACYQNAGAQPTYALPGCIMQNGTVSG
jgi:hypothetical protein